MLNRRQVYEAIFLTGRDPVGLGAGPLVFSGESGEPIPLTTEEVASAGESPVGTTMPGGWPAAVPVRPANWELQTDPAGYTIASGDTLSGLASTYLSGPSHAARAARWREIWDLNRDTIPNPDKIFAGQLIAMPDEAADNLIAFVALGKPTTTTPGKLTPAQKKKATAMRVLPWVVGAGLVGAVGYYLLS